MWKLWTPLSPLRNLKARYNLMPARSQGPNERCACGSHKKYKRCCGIGGAAVLVRAVVKEEIDKDGNLYEGEWRRGKEDGHGKKTYASGDKYEGEFKAGKKEGKGTLTYINGDLYVGEFSSGTPYCFINRIRYLQVPGMYSYRVFVGTG